MVEWNDVYGEVRTFIKEYLAEGKIIIKELPEEETGSAENKVETPKVVLEGVSAQIVSILDEYIKPAVAADGGNIVFRSYNEENKVGSVILQGACSGCPSSTATLKNGIENLLKEMLPNQINEVVAING
jgi:Fe-S cluster biogenesis protein NfuA